MLFLGHNIQEYISIKMIIININSSYRFKSSILFVSREKALSMVQFGRAGVIINFNSNNTYFYYFPLLSLAQIIQNALSLNFAESQQAKPRHLNTKLEILTCCEMLNDSIKLRWINQMASTFATIKCFYDICVCSI